MPGGVEEVEAPVAKVVYSAHAADDDDDGIGVVEAELVDCAAVECGCEDGGLGSRRPAGKEGFFGAGADDEVGAGREG